MKKCACRRALLERFIQPSILLLLNEEPMHGFSILKRPYRSDIMDYSSMTLPGLYRTLKKMEEAGLLGFASGERKIRSRPNVSMR